MRIEDGPSSRLVKLIPLPSSLQAGSSWHGILTLDSVPLSWTPLRFATLRHDKDLQFKSRTVPTPQTLRLWYQAQGDS